MPAVDRYVNSDGGVSAPADVVFDITPSDSEDLSYITSALYVGGGGDIEVITRQGTIALFKDVPSGTILPVRALRIGTETTATDLVGMA